MGSRDVSQTSEMTFTLMTFNVEEYHHSYGLKQPGSTLKGCVFETIAGIRAIIEAHDPDVLCIEEHSLGKQQEFTQEDIMVALVGGLNYEYISEATGEKQAWFSPLANVVLWKIAKFTLEKSWRLSLTSKDDIVPGATQTPRAATCAELVHLQSR